MGKDLQTLNRQNKLSLWAGRISECRNSGQNVKAWCRENGVCEQTYYKWQKRLFEIAQAQQEIQFAEVTPVQPWQLCHSGSYCPYHDTEIRYGLSSVPPGTGD